MALQTGVCFLLLALGGLAASSDGGFAGHRLDRWCEQPFGSATASGIGTGSCSGRFCDFTESDFPD
jgi:hypothetical protein